LLFFYDNSKKGGDESAQRSVLVGIFEQRIVHLDPFFSSHASLFERIREHQLNRWQCKERNPGLLGGITAPSIKRRSNNA
jgi:hypothetical protein